MKRVLLVLVVAAVAFAGCVTAQSADMPVVPVTIAPQLPWKVVASYPHDSTAFTQGLLWAKGTLYESTGLWGQSSLRKVDLISGKVLLQHHLPDNVFAEGLALLNGRLLQLTWKKQRAYMYRSKDFHALGTLTYEGEGWGLTTDGVSWISSNGSDTLTWRDAKTFKPQRALKVTWNGRPVQNLNELEWIEGVVWANVWHKNWILQIDPKSGKVLSYLDVSSLIPQGSNPENVPNGIAYDSENKRIFITGKRWPQLYEIRVN